MRSEPRPGVHGVNDSPLSVDGDPLVWTASASGQVRTNPRRDDHGVLPSGGGDQRFRRFRGFHGGMGLRGGVVKMGCFRLFGAARFKCIVLGPVDGPGFLSFAFEALPTEGEVQGFALAALKQREQTVPNEEAKEFGSWGSVGCSSHSVLIPFG